VIEPGGVKSEWADIAIENLLKTATNSVYKAGIERFASFLRRSTENNSEPMVIAKLILEGIIGQKKLKLRYVGDYNANMAVIARKLLSDKLFDKVILGQMK
jgi:hypothetical protein